MTKKSEIGKAGEDLACDYLKKQGCKIIERNFRRPWGEIDIVCQDTDKTLVFVEVKTVTRQDNDVYKPTAEDQLTKSKLAKITKTAVQYAGDNQKSIDDRKGWRIDLLALTINNEDVDIKHYKNIA